MKSYSVKKLADLSGVSVRTLHHYDKIGLLVPSVRTEAKYRLYGEKELLRLQQILFYKELDFHLKEICDILDDPDFDLINALANHRTALKARQNRITTLLVTIDKTIKNLKKGGAMLQPEDLYKGLPEETAESYRKEAIEKYGKDKVEKSENVLRKLSKEQLEILKTEQKQNRNQLYALRDEKPESKAVQKEIAKHYEIIRQFWGTTGSTDNQAEAYAGLGQLYVNDERFMAVDGKPQPEFALFVSKAMAYFSKTKLAK